MLPDRVSNPGPLTYESDALPTVLRGPATWEPAYSFIGCWLIDWILLFDFTLEI